MEREIDEVFSLNINNPTSTKQAITMFDIPSELAGTGNTITIPGTDTGAAIVTGGGATSGDMLPSDNITAIKKDITNNILYVGTTDAGLWILNITTGVGKVYNSTTPVGSGDQLPSNSINCIYLDIINNFIWCGTDSGVWRFNISTLEGKIFNVTTGAANGQQLGGMDIRGIDRANDIIWVATDVTYSPSSDPGGVWRYNTLTDTGKRFTYLGGVGSGSNFPSKTCYALTINQNIVWANAGNYGVWAYNIATDTGSFYNSSGGAGSGDQLPIGVDASTGYNIVSVDDEIWVPVIGNTAPSGGVWRYNITTDTGKVYNKTSGAGSGDQLPDNYVYWINVSSQNNYVFASRISDIGGTYYGIWKYDITNDIGSIINTSTIVTGDLLPNNFVDDVCLDETNNILYAGMSVGYWTLSVGLPSHFHPITSNDAETYHELCLENIDRPKRIHKIKFSFRNNAIIQEKNLITIEYYTSHGALEKKVINLFNYKSPTDTTGTIDIEFPEPLIIGIYFKIEFNIEPSTSMDMLFYYDEGEEVEKKEETQETPQKEQEKEQKGQVNKVVIDWLLIGLLVGTSIFLVINKKNKKVIS